MEIYATQVVLFLLLFVRCTSLLVAAPFFGHEAVPVQIKVGLGMFIAFVLYPLMSAGGPQVDLRLGPLVLLAVKEAGVGLTIGFAASLIFSGVIAAGELVGFDLGFSMATVFDPETGVNNPIVGQFFYVIFMLVFFLVNGHHHVLQTLVLTYDVVPVGSLEITGSLVDRIVSLCGIVFAVAAKLAAPVIVASFLINVAFSVLARVAPQINVFVVSFPVKIGVGLLVLMTAGPMMVFVFKKLLSGFERNVLELIKVM